MKTKRLTIDGLNYAKRDTDQTIAALRADLKKCEEERDLYEAMKEGVAIRIGDLEADLTACREECSGWRQAHSEEVENNQAICKRLDGVREELARYKAAMEPVEGECNLGKEALGDQCCCQCEYQLTDYWYCRSMPEELKPKDGCGCSVVRGYICTAGELFEGRGGHSGWPHHSMGCECFKQREAVRRLEGDDG